MHAVLTHIVLLLLLGLAPAWADDRPAAKNPDPPGPEDRKIIAVMEILQLMEITEEMEMIKDLDYLIEDEQDDPTTD